VPLISVGTITRLGGREFLVIGLVSCAVLLYAILVTRILSVVLWYHFAFLSISLAMLGLGAPGVWYSLAAPGAKALERSLIAAGVLTPLSVVAILQWGSRFGESAPFWVLVLLAPLAAMGSAVCLLIIAAPGNRVARIYGADLLGATLGALLVIPLMHGIPTPPLVASLGLLPLGAALLCGTSPRIVAALATALLVSIAWGKPYELRYTKSRAEVTPPLYERWTPTARVAVFPARKTDAFAWGMGSRYRHEPVEQLWLELDGSAGSPITRFDGSLDGLEHLFFDVTSAAYQIRKPSQVCIIGAGGGRDILTALKAGASRVDAVELNPFIVEAVGETFGEFSGGVYHLPAVRAVVDEGRSFLTRTAEHYDVLQISLIDTWAATAVGAYSLSENNLYTLEAFRLYWQRLAPDGILTISRWISGSMQMEASRLALLADAALRQEGIGDPLQHIVLLQGDRVGNLLLFKRPRDRARMEAIDRIAAERGFVRRWPASARDDSLLSVVLREGPARLERMGFDLSPPSDDRPFFFQTLNILRVPDASVQAVVGFNEKSVVLLRQLLVTVAVATLCLFFIPFLLRRHISRAAGFGAGSAYFSSIGCAFMFVEIPLINRFTLYLGHPSRAVVVVLGTMLLGAGLGALSVSSLAAGRARAAVLLLPLLLTLQTVALHVLFAKTQSLSLPLRAALAIAIVAPPSYLMGFAFPLGMMRFGEGNRSWFWAVNGATSVVASVSTLALAMVFGFAAVQAVGIVCYVAAGLLLWRGAWSS